MNKDLISRAEFRRSLPSLRETQPTYVLPGLWEIRFSRRFIAKGGYHLWEQIPKSTGAMQRGTRSLAVYMAANTATRGGLQSGLAGVGGSTCRRIQAGVEMLAKES